jgi:hypothetical protein
MDDLIYCQKAIPKEKWRYGFRSSAATGCGWIATYNALRLMGKPACPKELIRYYEWQLPLLHGNLGTEAWGPYIFFRQKGYDVHFVLKREKFDEAAKAADVCILFYRWKRKWKLGAHFVALHHRDNGFTGYNTYTNSTGPDRYGPSLDSFLKAKGYFGCVLMTIKEETP